MSTAIQQCPGCESFILSDTIECPECGHILDESRSDEVLRRRAAREQQDQEPARQDFNQLYEICRNCNERVRAGLVRCWSCGTFMRDDVRKKYEDLTTNPQPIIFSQESEKTRREYLPPRRTPDGREIAHNVFDADDFSVEGGFDEVAYSPSTATTETGGFQLAADVESGAPSPPAVDGPDRPESETPGRKSQATEAKSGAAPDSESAAKLNDGDAGSEDADLLAIAIAEEKESRKKRRMRAADDVKRKMLIPCGCGSWIRVHEDQAGRTVRCRKCRRPISVPQFKRRKSDESEEGRSSAEALEVAWLEDVTLHDVDPTNLVLKPGSLADKSIAADMVLDDDGIHLLIYGGDADSAKDNKKGGGLFGLGGKKKSDVSESSQMRKTAREHRAEKGSFEGLSKTEDRLLAAASAGEVKMMQPVAEVHHSMFAGVPVFGDGRIALLFPIATKDNSQTVVSFSLSEFRSFAEQFKDKYGVEIPAVENGVPSEIQSDILKCELSQGMLKAAKDVEYYQNDEGFEVTLIGYRCEKCNIAISEESRAKEKLGGANGKGIAKAKCPKCKGKFGNRPLYKVEATAASEQHSDDK